MHIVAIGWLYVTLMMAITEKNITAGVLTFVFYGLMPCALLLWLGGTRLRRRAARAQSQPQSIAAPSVPDEQANHPDGANPRADK